MDIRETFDRTIRLLLNDRPGEIKLGNVVFFIEKVGDSLCFDIPSSRWDREAISADMAREIKEYISRANEIGELMS